MINSTSSEQLSVNALMWLLSMGEEGRWKCSEFLPLFIRFNWILWSDSFFLGSISFRSSSNLIHCLIHSFTIWFFDSLIQLNLIPIFGWWQSSLDTITSGDFDHTKDQVWIWESRENQKWWIYEVNKGKERRRKLKVGEKARKSKVGFVSYYCWLIVSLSPSLSLPSISLFTCLSQKRVNGDRWIKVTGDGNHRLTRLSRIIVYPIIGSLPH